MLFPSSLVLASLFLLARAKPLPADIQQQAAQQQAVDAKKPTDALASSAPKSAANTQQVLSPEEADLMDVPRYRLPDLDSMNDDAERGDDAGLLLGHKHRRSYRDECGCLDPRHYYEPCPPCNRPHPLTDSDSESISEGEVDAGSVIVSKKDATSASTTSTTASQSLSLAARGAGIPLLGGIEGSEHEDSDIQSQDDQEVGQHGHHGGRPRCICPYPNPNGYVKPCCHCPPRPMPCREHHHDASSDESTDGELDGGEVIVGKKSTNQANASNAATKSATLAKKQQ